MVLTREEVRIMDVENITDAIEKAREYQKTKSITTATEVCNMLVKWAEWADETLELVHGGNNEQ